MKYLSQFYKKGGFMEQNATTRVPWWNDQRVSRPRSHLERDTYQVGLKDVSCGDIQVNVKCSFKSVHLG
ncbi:hypothetical protein FRX31_032974 [Thalictrum thalictroides]|uniref:Uncharacterized protein n=1 Tax=Thalictrum thalictroides TaxID=46969 RepID=A0A7J6UXU0_THATH|nr:hypothetical protein FRX31_032974 [Thalictrum thalictroides]